MKKQNATSTASASMQELNSDQELTETELERAAGGTTIPFPRTPIPDGDSILVVASSSDLLQTKM